MLYTVKMQKMHLHIFQFTGPFESQISSNVNYFKLDLKKKKS